MQYMGIRGGGGGRGKKKETGLADANHRGRKRAPAKRRKHESVGGKAL